MSKFITEISLLHFLFFLLHFQCSYFSVLAAKVVLVVRNPPGNARDVRDMGSIPSWEDLCRRKWQPTPAFLPGETHGQRSLAGYSPWSCKESDTTEQPSFVKKFAAFFPPWALEQLK